MGQILVGLFSAGHLGYLARMSLRAGVYSPLNKEESFWPEKLQFQLNADFDDLVWWDIKERGGIHGIAGQKEKQ